MAAPVAEKVRDAARSREAILDAAESLFAEQGYEGTSLSDVGTRAGMSRGTPGYFFGSKAELYRAVLERCFAEVLDAVRSGRRRALASGVGPDVVLAGAVSDYFDFLAARPNFVRLIEWEALGGGQHLEEVPPHVAAAQEALSALREELGLGPGMSQEAAQLLLSIIGLCWFPLAHSATVLRALGIQPDDPGFLEQRKQHVIDLVLNGIRGRFSVQADPNRMLAEASNRTPGHD
jgi:AcrR family transcriptional regulator